MRTWPLFNADKFLLLVQKAGTYRVMMKFFIVPFILLCQHSFSFIYVCYILIGFMNIYNNILISYLICDDCFLNLGCNFANLGEVHWEQ
jgi:hypothetical protein